MQRVFTAEVNLRSNAYVERPLVPSHVNTVYVHVMSRMQTVLALSGCTSTTSACCSIRRNRSSQREAPWHVQIANTSSFDGSIKMLSDMGLHDEKQRREDPHGRSLLPYKMSKVRLQLAYVSCFSQS